MRHENTYMQIRESPSNKSPKRVFKLTLPHPLLTSQQLRYVLKLEEASLENSMRWHEYGRSRIKAGKPEIGRRWNCGVISCGRLGLVRLRPSRRYPDVFPITPQLTLNYSPQLCEIYRSRDVLGEPNDWTLTLGTVIDSLKSHSNNAIRELKNI